MKLVGIASQMQAGKDTLADYLAQELNKTMGQDFWRRDAFAKKVKQIYCDAFNKDMDFIEKWKLIPEPPPGMDMSVRKSLEFIGNGFRKIQKNVWIDYLFSKDEPIIISDIRYINELKAIKAKGGFTILLARPNKLNNNKTDSESQIKPLLNYALGVSNRKPKEMEFVDAFILNNGTIENLYSKGDNLIPIILKYFSLQE